MLTSLARQISQRSFLSTHPIRHPQACIQCISLPSRHYSDASSKSSDSVKETNQKLNEQITGEVKPKKKTQAELDAEVMAKLQGHDSEGGAAGIEYEDGKPASMKRSVRNNMFRYI